MSVFHHNTSATSTDTWEKQAGSSSYRDLVVPGQIIAVSTPMAEGEESAFLRGHGTYLETSKSHNHKHGLLRLRASVVGTIQRVNKLISVVPLSDTRYDGHVGDLVVGRIVQVTHSRWKVDIGTHQERAVLPLQGVHLPGGVQRVRTAQDARDMRQVLREGDVVSAEVHKILTTSHTGGGGGGAGSSSSGTSSGGTLQLHTRSTRYGKLQNGCLLVVPPGRIPKRKNHFVTLRNEFDILLGCNGYIWIQRTLPKDDDNNTTGSSSALPKDTTGPELAEWQEERRRQHAATPYTPQERQNLARLRNAIECLRYMAAPITVEAIARVYEQSLVQMPRSPAAMLQDPARVLQLTTSHTTTTEEEPMQE